MTKRGTKPFMAPEIFYGEEGDFRVDICSLGLVLYRLMNQNRAPFLPLPPEKVLLEMYDTAQRRRLKGEVPPPPAMADRRLGAIILKACAHRAADRWASAAHLRQALHHWKSCA